MARDFNVEKSPTNSIEPPKWIKLLKTELSKECSNLKNRELILSLTTGERKFSPKFRNDMVNTGTMHLVAISAFHTGIMVVLFNIVFKFFLFFAPFRHKTSSILLFIFKLAASIFYFFITGSSIPTLRALTFILFFDLFLMTGQFPHHTALFIFSLTATAAIIPHSITSISFLMSAICVGTVIKIYKVLPKSATVQLISISALLNYALLPVYPVISGTLPLLAALANLFAIPVISIAVPAVTLAQFSAPFSLKLASYFLKIGDFLIEPAQFMIGFLGNAAEKSLFPLIDPPFVIKFFFVLSFFTAVYFRGKIKITAIAINLTMTLFFVLNFQKAPHLYLRSEKLFNKAFVVTYSNGTGKIFFDRYRFSPNFNQFLLQRMELAASQSGINRVTSIHTPHKLPKTTKDFIRKRKRFSSTKFFFKSYEDGYLEDPPFFDRVTQIEPFP
ncbi:MAG: ComEC/Rec2 family competence protein [bacterium]